MAGNDLSESLMKFLTERRPAMYVAIRAVLSQYVSRRQMGFVLDFGDGLSHTMSISKVTLCLTPSVLGIWLTLVLLSI